MAAENKDLARDGADRRSKEVSEGGAPATTPAIRVGADTLSVGRDLFIANRLRVEGRERQKDPRLEIWLRELASFRQAGLVEQGEHDDLCAWAAGEAPAGEGPLEVAVDASILAQGAISSPAQARRRQILAALRLNGKPRIQGLGVPFLLVPPGRSEDGRYRNEGAFYLARTVVSEALWAKVLEEGRASTRRDRAKVGISRQRIEEFVEAAQRRLGSGARIVFPTPANLAFAEAVGGRIPASQRRRLTVAQLGTTEASSLGLQDLSGVVYQLCREGDTWSWWGGGFATPLVRSSEALPCLPSRSTFEEGPEYGFRPLLYLHDPRRGSSSGTAGEIEEEGLR